MIVLDAQLLVLLAVGATSRRLIEKHKNTHQFDEDDFDLLETLLGRHEVLLLPNVVTEASNLVRQHRPPERHSICRTLQRLVASSHEVYVASRVACDQPDYIGLGVTDAALILASERDVLLTADVQLYVSASSRGLQVINFNHERERNGLA